ncbi:hypothetical protein BH11PSE13_BH11PSE13_31170 [soil metagenome]
MRLFTSTLLRIFSFTINHIVFAATLAQHYADAGALLGAVQTQVQITSAFTSTFGPVVADAAVSWLTGFFAPMGATAVPTPGNPTPAATELVQGDQATRQGFATIQGDPTISSDLKTFMLDLKTIYDNDAFVRDAVHQAVSDPLAYQMSLTGGDASNPMVKVIFPAVAAAGAGSSAAAGGHEQAVQRWPEREPVHPTDLLRRGGHRQRQCGRDKANGVSRDGVLPRQTGGRFIWQDVGCALTYESQTTSERKP